MTGSIESQLEVGALRLFCELDVRILRVGTITVCLIYQINVRLRSRAGVVLVYQIFMFYGSELYHHILLSKSLTSASPHA